jgi:hypothetical protein
MGTLWVRRCASQFACWHGATVHAVAGWSPLGCRPSQQRAAAFSSMLWPGMFHQSFLPVRSRWLTIPACVPPQSRLTEHLHQNYCSNRAYYAATTLGGARRCTALRGEHQRCMHRTADARALYVCQHSTLQRLCRQASAGVSAHHAAAHQPGITAACHTQHHSTNNYPDGNRRAHNHNHHHAQA